MPGDLTVRKLGVLLSTGLDTRIVAHTGQRVPYSDGTESPQPFHKEPDHGAAFPVPPASLTNPGGWVYVSNSEVKSRDGVPKGRGGVGAVTFDKDGNVIDYQMILKGTTANCGGGKTPWGTWVSCEEYGNGQVWEVDPHRTTPPQKTVLGGQRGGAFESFAYDVRDMSQPRFFVTEDVEDGALRRWTPTNPNWNDTGSMLHGEGTMEYLILTPSNNNNKVGTYKWVTDKKKGDVSAKRQYPNTEGIDVVGSDLYFVSKTKKELIVLDLDGDAYSKSSTRNGAFDGGPDQIVRLIGPPAPSDDPSNDVDDGDRSILYFTEEGGKDAGVHGRDARGRYFTVLESPVYEEETAGLAFSPDGKRMYIAYQRNGVLLEVWREDGRPFYGRDVNVKYHSG